MFIETFYMLDMVLWFRSFGNDYTQSAVQCKSGFHEAVCDADEGINCLV